ncbi:hypothetical protein F3Y22_tig00003041pilonHSYRG00675 [Hibiscus syriacus]|uniref:Uncharacterized protein n=1 Tax=Hibiscus syriacus TaxID=106335 RepID=A0A6A3CLQ0_HIBSY|nr:hypothetical protein F3Y22_tig00003041pilonHSYRG00675 [Hibiscus syriacus]
MKIQRLQYLRSFLLSFLITPDLQKQQQLLKSAHLKSFKYDTSIIFSFSLLAEFPQHRHRKLGCQIGNSKDFLNQNRHTQGIVADHSSPFLGVAYSVENTQRLLICSIWRRLMS